MNEHALICLLQTNIPNITIIYNHPDKINNAIIKKIELCKYFNDTQLDLYFKDIPTNIPLKSFVDYMEYANRKSNTKGLYHQYMPYINAYYNINVDNLGFPEYSSHVNPPSRIEYSILFGIKYFLDQNTFLKNKFKMEYQYKLDDKYYDAAVPELKILIEVQEDKENHNNNDADLHKRLIAKFNEYYIVYFHESDLNKDLMSLKHFVENKLTSIIYGAISYYYKEDTLALIHQLYIEKLKEDENIIKNIVINQKKERIKIINENIEYFSDSSPIKKIMEKYIQNELTVKEKYFITLKDIYFLYPDLEKNTNFHKELATNLYYTKVTKNTIIYYPWSIINFIIVKYSDTVNDSVNYLTFLTELDELYKKLLNYNNDYLKECKINKDEFHEYCNKKESNMLKHYKDELKSTKNQLELYKSSLDTIAHKFKLPSFIKSINNIMISPFIKKSKDAAKSILTSLNLVNETMKQIDNTPTEFSYQKIHGLSIIKELPDFPYLYYPESNGVEYKKIYAELKSNLLLDSTIFSILKQYTTNFNHDKTEIIHKIIHIDTYTLLIEEIIELEEDSVTDNSNNSDSSDSNSIGELDEFDELNNTFNLIQISSLPT
jgi:hypothetical protein